MRRTRSSSGSSRADEPDGRAPLNEIRSAIEAARDHERRWYEEIERRLVAFARHPLQAFLGRWPGEELPELRQIYADIDPGYNQLGRLVLEFSCGRSCAIVLSNEAADLMDWCMRRPEPRQRIRNALRHLYARCRAERSMQRLQEERSQTYHFLPVPIVEQSDLLPPAWYNNNASVAITPREDLRPGLVQYVGDGRGEVREVVIHPQDVGAVQLQRQLIAAAPPPEVPEHLIRLQEQMLREVLAITGYGDPASFGLIGPDANARGRQLLIDNLTPAQREQYERRGWFEVKGCDTGKRYRIYEGINFNIEELDEEGRRAGALCFGPNGNLIVGDVMLAQKIALECFENEALKIANAGFVQDVTVTGGGGGGGAYARNSLGPYVTIARDVF